MFIPTRFLCSLSSSSLWQEHLTGIMSVRIPGNLCEFGSPNSEMILNLFSYRVGSGEESLSDVSSDSDADFEAAVPEARMCDTY